MTMPEPIAGRVSSCHCGRPVHVYEDGFTRDMCESCSAYRCDIEPNCPAPSRASGRVRSAIIACINAYEATPYPLKCEPMKVAEDFHALLRLLDQQACGDVLRWAGYTNVCDLSTGHEGRHSMTQPGNQPVIWGPPQRGIPTRNGSPE
jgi:hypothetical protein